ncbi:MAG: chromosome segregation protein SMC, partial [Aquabacterium commune]
SETVPALDDARKAAQADSQQQSGRLAERSARLEALRTLQDKVQTEGKLKPWLAKHGLDSLQGLWARVHIEAGWENALESALRERLSALEVGRVDTVRAFEQDAPPAKLAFYSPPASGIQNTHATLPRLSDLLRLNDAGLQALMNDWLEGVYTAAHLEEALAQRGKLTHGEVIMTPAGHAVSQFAVSFYAPDSEQAGMLARAQEIEGLDKEVRAQSLMADEARAALIRAEAAYTDGSQRLATARRDTTEAQQRLHQQQVEVLRLSQQAEQAHSRRSQISEELAEIDAQLEGLQERRALGEARFEELDIALGEAQEKHATLEEHVIEAERKLNQAREQSRALERQAQEATFGVRSMAARRGELQRSIETASQQVQANEATVAQLHEEQARLSEATAHTGLDEALALRVQREGLLALARQRYDDLSAQLRRFDEQRMGFEHSVQPLRDQITKLQLEQQAASLGGAQFMEQLTAAEVDLAALAETIERDGVKLFGLQAEIDRIQREVNALGAVNLAALDELTAARERKGFLDAQMTDLLDAIGTLEDAIHKIDLETRDLLGATFNTVNEHFGRMFPSLFGGGSARLVMTGDEILDAGVQVMAHPPGKKNSTIHLLSGGEKALTAIALVFAIFQLNPAPFCLLDEVDAPLDDANTERYARLVKSMSAGTQFLFISHNKIAMEMAEQLVGVTMQEQGVSRIVAVDMEAALGMAHAA